MKVQWSLPSSSKEICGQEAVSRDWKLAFLLSVDLVDIFSLNFDKSIFGKRSEPNGSILILDFQTIRAEVDAKISFSPRRPAFSSVMSDRTLSVKRVWVIDRDALFRAQLIFSVSMLAPLSSLFILNGIAAGAAAIILPTKRPLVNIFSRCGGTQ